MELCYFNLQRSLNPGKLQSSPISFSKGPIDLDLLSLHQHPPFQGWGPPWWHSKKSEVSRSLKKSLALHPWLKTQRFHSFDADQHFSSFARPSHPWWTTIHASSSSQYSHGPEDLTPWRCFRVVDVTFCWPPWCILDNYSNLALRMMRNTGIPHHIQGTRNAASSVSESSGS